MKDVCQKVYFARCIGPKGTPLGAYKIGCSFGHNDRVEQLTANLPFTAELVAVTPGSMVMEAACHLWLRPYRIAGEYFSDAEPVEGFIADVARTGRAFNYITDHGDAHHQFGQDDLLTPFMAYHGVTMAEACLRMGKPADAYVRQRNIGTNGRLIAAVAVVAAERQQYVNWPVDVIAGLRGERAVSHARPRALREQIEAGQGEAA